MTKININFENLYHTTLLSNFLPKQRFEILRNDKNLLNFLDHLDFIGLLRDFYPFVAEVNEIGTAHQATICIVLTVRLTL